MKETLKEAEWKLSEYRLGELKPMLTFNFVAFFKLFQLRTKSCAYKYVLIVDVQIETLGFAIFKSYCVLTKQTKINKITENLNTVGWALQNGNGKD